MKKLFLLIIILFISIIPAPSYAAGDRILEIRIKGLKGVDENLVRAVLPIKPNMSLKLENLDKSISYLRKWGVFDTIEAKKIDTPDGAIVEISFGEAKIITEIDVSGNYPYLENKLLKYLTINPGDIYTRTKVEDQIERLKEFYEREGFIDAEIYVKESPELETNGVKLTFHIASGDRLRLRNISVVGNKNFPSGRFVSIINPFKAFSEKKLRASLRDLVEFYRNHGFPRVRIWVVKKEIDFEKHAVDLTLGIDEGSHARIRFHGNKHVSKRVLKKAITIFREGSYDAYEIDASVEAIKQIYKERGFPNAAVETSVNSKKDVLINFKISEGESEIIRRIKFRGNKNVGAKSLKKQMSIKQHSLKNPGSFDPAKVAKDTETIKSTYGNFGYREAQVGSWEKKTTAQGFDFDITIPVSEGEKTFVGRTNFLGNSIPARKLLNAVKLKKEKPFNLSLAEKDKQTILEYYADHGYPYVEIKQMITDDPKANTVNITYEIKEGAHVRIGRILIVGDVLTSQKAIKNAMSIHEGDPFSYKKIVDSQLNLRRLGAFSSVMVETIGLVEKEDSVQLLVRVSEQRPFHLDLGFGYSTDQQFAGSLAFVNFNSFGWAKHTLFKLTAGRELGRAELGWLDPAFLGSSFEMSVLSWVQFAKRSAFDYLQTAGSLSFLRRFKRFGLFFKYEVDRNYLIEGSSTAADAASLRDNTISKISLSSSYDTRESFSYPTRGFYTLGGADIFNEIRGREANFAKLFWQGENDFTLWRFTLSTAARFNRIQTIGADVSVPTNELLFLGGDDTIRGFGEDSLGPANALGNPTGARTRWILNEELRLKLFSRLVWACFYDMGSLTNDFSDINWGSVRHSAGFGLRYITPVGPIRAEYGIKLDPMNGESFGRFHLTFGYVF